MAAPPLVTLLFDALVAVDPDNAKALTARKLAEQLEHKVVVIDPDELHTIDIKPDGSFTMGHPIACRPELYGCLFHAIAMKGFEAPHPGRWTVVLDDKNATIRVADLIA